MKPKSLHRIVARWMVPLSLALLLAEPGRAQDSKAGNQTGAATQAAGSAQEPAKTARKKPRGRLPVYFAKVVSVKQRTEIYAIQAKFTDQIAKLEEQLKQLVSQRNVEVEKVLTDEQRAEVEKMRAARRSRAKASSNAASGSN